MQFTPQQMAGAQRYGSQTRIGNWYEDERLAEARFTSFTDKKERKLLASDYRRKKMGTCLQKVPLSSCSENLVRYGAVIRLESAEVGGSLACDPFEETSHGSQSYLATVCPSSPPQPPASTTGACCPARAAFKIVAVTDPRLKDMATQVKMHKENRDSLPNIEGEPVRYGDSFHLVCDPGLRVCEVVNMRRPPLYLSSALKTQSLSSRVSNRQAVFLRAGALSGTVWQFQKTTHGKDGTVERMMGVGSPVFADANIVVQHRDTLMALSCQKDHVEPTDFGAEFEVCCQNKTTNGKSLQLLAEMKGTKTAAAAGKAELRANHWLVRQGKHETVRNETADGNNNGCGGGGGDEEGGVLMNGDSRRLPPEMTFENLLSKAKGIVQRRPAGIHCLRSALSSNDSTGSGKIDREDVRWCLHDCGVTLDDEQSQILLDKYDRDGSGLMRIEELLSGLREPLSDRRKRVVEEAFGDLSPDNDGKLDIKMWQRTFDAYASGRALIGDVNPLVETLDSLTFGLTAGSLSKTGTVTLQDFERYHQDICVDVDNDDLFEAVVKAAWRSGGTTTAAAAAES